MDDEMMAEGRSTNERAQARYACWWLVEKMTELGPGTIGRLSGNRDHATIVAGQRRAEELRASSPEFRASSIFLFISDGCRLTPFLLRTVR